MSSIIPLFKGGNFDDQSVEILGEAYDIACRSLHRKGQPPVVQEFLAKKIIEAAQFGERDPDRLAGIALGMLSPLYREVSQRFGLVPNFFLSTPDAPEIVEKLWDFAKSAYLDSPLPALFKERLFVFLSRFCPVRYCVVRHCAFLVGYGYASGDISVARQTIEQAIKLLKVPEPWQRALEPIYERLEGLNSTIDWPSPESEAEDWIFAMCALMFVHPTTSGRALENLRHALGAKRLEYLLALLAFTRTAHYWTMVHPKLEIENDAKELIALNEELASLLLKGSELG